MSVDHDLIPNNVDLSSDKRLQRALTAWHPKFMEWWKSMGPDSFQEKDVYLRTAVSVESGGWANYDYVQMPDYRWGIFLTPFKDERTISFGDNIGQPTWNEVPGEFRKELRRLIVTQADTEPASVEQQRMLGHIAPSLMDMRSLFQVNVEEARHLWAMVYLLHQHFGKRGREEAEDLLIRRSGDVDTPRILSTFNDPIEDWFDLFCFTMFTDRDGKFQLAALAESAFEPLARTTRFMLTEEAYHLSVGETGIGRVIQRSAELLKSEGDDLVKAGAIPFELIQKYINFWFSSSLDLFGSEDSSNAASFFAAGLKGRFDETNRELNPDPKGEGEYSYETWDDDGQRQSHTIPMRRAMNALLRDAYIKDCERVLKRWNRVLEREDLPIRMTLPSARFNRRVGVYAPRPYDPEGNPKSDAEFEKMRDTWLPTPEDKAYVKSLMVQVTEPGKFANWIAAPRRGVNKQPVNAEYVRL